jgi:thiosulfate/3-mercaptopyruvate sulfurtransferase
MKKLILLTAIAFFFTAQGADASSSVASKGYVKPQWLKAHAYDRNLLIVDVSLKPEDYVKGHIPNSVYVDWKRDMADQSEKRYYRIVPKEGFEKVMSRIGATHDTTLIFYDNLNNRLAIRALWVARFYGHENAAILEGGISAWKWAGFETTSNKPARTPSKYKVQMVHSDMNVQKRFVKENLRNKKILFVDSRRWKMYTGEIPGMMIHTGKQVARRGHLPSAIHLPWKSNIDKSSMFLDKSTLMGKYSKVGLRKDRPVVFYCNEGVHAAYNWFVATELLGFKNVQIYEGSMGEWADQPLFPMVSGIGF